MVIPDGQGRVTAVIFGDDHVAPVFAAFTLLDSKIWVNVRTQIPKPRNSNTIRSLLFISESMEGILQEEMTPLRTPNFEAWLYRHTYKGFKTPDFIDCLLKYLSDLVLYELYKRLTSYRCNNSNPEETVQ